MWRSLLWQSLAALGGATQIGSLPCLSCRPRWPSQKIRWLLPGNTKGGSIIVQLTSCLTYLDLSVLEIKTKNVNCHTADSKPVKQEVNITGILPTLVFPCCCCRCSCHYRAKICQWKHSLRSIYKSDFRARFCIKLVHFREQKIIVSLVNLQA